MSECSLSGRGQGHVSNFYIVDLENFATASRRYTGYIHNSTVVGLFKTRFCRTGQLAKTDTWFRTCRTSSFCTVAWQLARFQLTRRITRSLCDSSASCISNSNKCIGPQSAEGEIHAALIGAAHGESLCLMGQTDKHTPDQCFTAFYYLSGKRN